LVAILGALLGVLAGCTASPPERDSEASAVGETAAAPSEKTPGERVEKPVERHFSATVVDRFNATSVITDVSVFAPQFSFLGSNGGQTKHVFPVKIGAAEMEVPFEGVDSIRFNQITDDRIAVVVSLRNGKLASNRLECTLRANLQLRGVLKGTDFPATVRVRDLSKMTISETR